MIRRSDYQPPSFLIDQIDLRFELNPRATRVTARSAVRRNPAGPRSRDLILDGEQLELARLLLDGAHVDAARFELGPRSLRIADVPDAFALELESVICPEDNKALEGLYVSGGNFCTQCEAEGFRRITWYLDRPDVMAKYRTTLVADRATYPVLLSNGNLVETGALEAGRHFAVWDDPFPKPSYLFALVAGALVRREDSFTTRSGRKVALHVYVRARDLDQTEHCMASIKQAMRWDEEAFGREYDLDIFQIVAVSDFNMGAMENKGLNIFNTQYVLARPDTATDTDYHGIESVVGHEYFHNWSGDRVTCRDWFQLSLKEGFTVFRDQEFSADMGSRAVVRIDDVRRLWEAQFPEDAGPTAHPVRPDSYVEINNFYTATVYEKGAEVVRMLQTLLGHELFRRGCDLYFSRHDGQAVTCDDFVQAMQDVSGRDLTQFKHWYSQAGTPELQVHSEYNAAAREYHLTLRQSTAPTPGQPEKAPLHIPVLTGLLAHDGRELRPTLRGANARDASYLLELTDAEQTFVFSDVPEKPIPSVLRGYSAPVRLSLDSTDAELRVRMTHDSDPFCRWQACHTLQMRTMCALAEAAVGRTPHVDATPLVDAMLATLRALEPQNTATDFAYVARLLQLPSEHEVALELKEIDPDAIHTAWVRIRSELARAGAELLELRYNQLAGSGAQLDAASIGRRALRNQCLEYLALTPAAANGELVYRQFAGAQTMTDRLAALASLVRQGGHFASQALAEFHERFSEHALVMDKWFAVQTIHDRAGILDEVRALMKHPQFDLRNPNKVRALIGAFSQRNLSQFHRADGVGYTFLADQVIALNSFNPQIAARLLTAFRLIRRFDTGRQAHMTRELQRILTAPGLSPDVFEIASKTLQ